MIIFDDGQAFFFALPIDFNHFLLVRPNFFVQQERALNFGKIYSKTELKIKMIAWQLFDLLGFVFDKNISVIKINSNHKIGLNNANTDLNLDKPADLLFSSLRRDIREALLSVNETDLINIINELKADNFFEKNFFGKSTTLSKWIQMFLNSLVVTVSDPLLIDEKFCEQARSLRDSLMINISFIKDQNDFLKFFNDLIWSFYDLYKQEKRFYKTTMAEEIKKHLLNNIDKKVPMDELVKKFNASKQKINKEFKENFGMTTKKFILNERIKISKKLILENKNSFQEISDQLGFIDKSYFIKVFHQETGKTPKQFKKDSRA